MIERSVLAIGLCVLAACGGDTKLETCNISEASCQYEVFLAVQDVRGSLWDPWIEPPRMDVISEAQYRAQVIAARERALQQTGRDWFSEGLKLLRMIDPDETPEEEVNQKVEIVAAFYSALVHRVTIIEREEIQNPAQGVQTLAHELVHAAQDRDVGLSLLDQYVASTDNQLALSALVEGEAVTYEYLVSGKQLDVPKTFIDWRIFEGWLIEIRRRAFDDPSPYRVATTELLYPLGGTYVAAAYAEGGPLEVRKVYDPPPLSAARFMAGRKSPGDVAPPPWTCLQINPPSGYELVIGDELGGLGLFAFATRFSPIEILAWDSASAWTGDRFYVFRKPGDDDALVVVWLVRFASPQAAAAAQTALDGVAWPRPLQSFVQGDTLHVLVSRSELDMPYEAWMGCN